MTKYKDAFIGLVIGLIIGMSISIYRLKECQEQNDIIKDLIIESP
jgi:uncharacterized membrane-anchored protein YhcB (DUF1043 family)